MSRVQASGKYIYQVPSMSTSIDYTKFLTEYLSQDQKWVDLFKSVGEVITDETENPLNQLLRLRDAASCSPSYQALNNKMLGFNVPSTGYSNDEAYLTMKTLANFYITRQASYSFLSYLSFIKNALLEPIPLWAQSVTDSIEDLVAYSDISGVYYTPTKISVIDGGKDFKIGDTISIPNTGEVTVTSINNSGRIETYNTNLLESSFPSDMGGEISEGYTTSGSGSGAVFLVISNKAAPSNYFPTVYYDISYDVSDFPVDEAVIKEFVIALQPAHLVFRKFRTYTNKSIAIETSFITQIFSYTGAKFTGTI